MKVLIADDDVICRNLLRRLVERWGYEVVMAEDGADAMRQVRAQTEPCVAILDRSMPKADGTEVCRRIKQDATMPYVYAIILTGRDTTEDMLDGLECGADDYLGKPVEADVLKSHLDAAAHAVQATMAA